MYEIDNLPYAPDLEFYTETEILDGGLPVFETYLNNFLEVKVTVVNSGCLLYTSPSPRDKRQSRMPSSA